MQKTMKTPKERVVERDWVQELEERKVITSAEMQFFVNRLGAQMVFNAPELAAALCTTVNSIYALVDEGKIGYINRGSKAKRYCIFPRESVLQFLQKRCNGI